MFSKYSFDCSFAVGCFVSKRLFNLLGTSASFNRAELQIKQNDNGSSLGSEDMKLYLMQSSLYNRLVSCFLFNALFHTCEYIFPWAVMNIAY